MRSKTTLLIGLMSMCACLVALWVYPDAPEHIPIHWGTNGKVNGTGPKSLLLFLPFLPIAIDLLMLMFRRIDPKKENYKKFTSSYDTMRLMIALVLFLCFYITISEMKQPGLLNIGTLITFGIGLMISVLGNVMPRFRPNYFVGLKTPWTLYNDAIWIKTHRFGGRLWFIGGLLICVSAFFQDTITLIIILIITLIITLTPMLYSYMLYKNKRKEGNTHD